MEHRHLALGCTAVLPAGAQPLMHHGRQLEARLRERYPCVAEVVGPECFAALMRRLALLHPAGEEDLPGLIEATEALAPLPYLADLARYEDLQDAPDGDDVGGDVLAGLRLFASEWDVPELYRWWRGGAPGCLRLAARRTALALWRGGSLPLRPAEYAYLGLRLHRLPGAHAAAAARRLADGFREAAFLARLAAARAVTTP